VFKEYLDLLADFINKVGFPIFVAVVLLWRVDSRHAENVRAMNELVKAVKDQHLAIHCRKIAAQLTRSGRRRRPKDKRR